MENYEIILRTNPNNPEANLGTGFIYTVNSSLDIANMVNQIMVSIISAKKSDTAFSRNDYSISQILNSIDTAKIQADLSVVVEKLEKAKKMLDIALIEKASMVININSLDWNNDGFTDSTSPLYFSKDFQGIDRRVWYTIFKPSYPEPLYYKRNLDYFLDSGIRGDAWFDKETFEFLINNQQIPEEYEPVFDENDKITFDATSIQFLKALVNTELFILEPLLIYDLSINQDTVDFFIGLSESTDPSDYSIRILDKDENGVITKTEIVNIIGNDIFKFLKNPNGGENAINDWKISINELTDYLLNNTNQDLLNSIFDPYSTHPLLLSSFAQILNSIKLMTSSLDYYVPLFADSQGGLFDIDRNGLPEILKPAVFFVNSTNFQDLKSFIPDFNQGLLNNKKTRKFSNDILTTKGKANSF